MKDRKEKISHQKKLIHQWFDREMGPGGFKTGNIKTVFAKSLGYTRPKVGKKIKRKIRL